MSDKGDEPEAHREDPVEQKPQEHQGFGLEDEAEISDCLFEERPMPKPAPYSWILFGVIVAICQGLSYFLLSHIFGTLGINGLGLVGPGTLTLIIVAKCLSMLVDQVRANGQICGHMRPCTPAKFSNLALQSVPQIAQMYMLALAWMFAFKGGLNQGVVTTLAGFTTVYMVMTEYAIFGMRIQTYQKLQGFMMVVCLVCMLVAAGLQENPSTETSGAETEVTTFSPASNYMAILFGFTVPIILSLVSCFRVCGIQINSSPDIMIDASIVEFLVYSFHFFGLTDDGSRSQLNFAIGTLAGVLLMVSRFCFFRAVCQGPAGPIVAIVNIGTLIQIVLCAVIMGQPLGLFEYLSVFAFVTATMIINYVPMLPCCKPKPLTEERSDDDYHKI